ncbi:MAG: hypothetical protein WC998_08300 [Candidatus Paceibacterota bacterium]
MEILICRLRNNSMPWLARDVAINLTAQGHNVHSIDSGHLDEYRGSGVFKSCHLWKWLDAPQIELENQFRDIVLKHKIELVIITQKLFLWSNVAEKICKELGIRVVFTEYFFDDKLIFDDIGLQYTKDNQSIGVCELPIDWPKKDREPQPADKSAADIITRHNLSDKKIVVIYGQVLWDMSLVESPEGITYDEYMDGLCFNNPDTTFLFKPHPKDTFGKNNSRKYKYPNMIRVKESLNTLFQFPAHTAYSSTVIFEGVTKGLRFASAGYHLLQDHTYKIKRDGFEDIYNKIIAYKLDMELVKKNASYLTNIYAMPMSDPMLADRLINGLNQGAREYVLAKEAAR